MRSTFVWVWAVCLTLVAAPLVAQETECGGPGPFFGDTGTDPASVDNFQVIINHPVGIPGGVMDVSAAIDITTAFVGDINMTLTSPDVVMTTLHAGGGGADDDLNVTYSDVGIPNAAPYNCACVMVPAGPGTMLDLATGTGVGDWTLDVTDTFPTSGGGTLNTACVTVSDTMAILPINSLTCTLGASLGVVDATWVNGSAYDSIEVSINGGAPIVIGGGDTTFSTPVQPVPSTVMLSIVGVTAGGASPPVICSVDTFLQAPDTLACMGNGATNEVSLTWNNPVIYDDINIYVDGALEATISGGETSYTTGAVAGPTFMVCLEGVVNVPAATSAQTCCNGILFTADLVECAGSGEAISDTLPPTVQLVTFTDDALIGDTAVNVDISHTFVGDLDITLTSPAATLVQLHALGGAGDDDINLIWDDAGIPNGPPYNCACVMQPAGPGTMADFNATSTLGDWTFTVTDTVGGDSGTLNQVCIGATLGCPVAPATDVACSDNGTDAMVSWTNNDDYDEIRVLRGGVEIATIGGSDTSYVDLAPGVGVQTYSVVGFSNTDMCGNESASCSVAIGITDLVWAHPDQDAGAVDDEAAILAALAANGISGVQAVDDLPADLSPFTRVWVLLGTYDAAIVSKHEMTFDEGQILADYCTNSGGQVYVSGNDHFAFDPPTPLADVDGVDGLADGQSAIATMSGQNSGVGLDLIEFPGLAFIGETSFDDDIAATPTGGAGVCWTNDALSEGLGVAYDAGLDTAPINEHRVIASTLEFAGIGTVDDQNAIMALYLGFLGGGGPPPSDSFSRGDCDGNGTFNGLLDGLRALNFQFVPGTPEPPCLRACDADGDRTFNGLIDGLRILNVQFVPGTPPPPAPYPGCGTDANDTVSCVTPPPACNP